MTDRNAHDTDPGDTEPGYPPLSMAMYDYANGGGWIPKESVIFHHVPTPVRQEWPPAIRVHHSMFEVSTHIYEEVPVDWQTVRRRAADQGIDLRMDYDLTGLNSTAPESQPHLDSRPDSVNPNIPAQEK